MKVTAQELEDLDIQETSGVDHPAHLIEGWLLMKNRGGSMETPAEDDETVELVLQEAEAYAEAHEQLLTSLEKAKPYLDDAPEDVRQSADVLEGYLAVGQKVEKTAESEEEKPSHGFIRRLMDGLRKEMTPAPTFEESWSSFVDEVAKAKLVEDAAERRTMVEQAVETYIGPHINAAQ